MTRRSIQWAQDSAYRFFPLVPHADLGLTLHPFDLATSKVLALVGRVEPRDFVDTLTCDREVQPLGDPAWAACGKGPRIQPQGPFSSWPPVFVPLLRGRAPGARLRGRPPGTRRAWPGSGGPLLDTAREIVAALPADEAGRAVLAGDGVPATSGGQPRCREALRRGDLRYHEGRIRGAFPRILR